MLVVGASAWPASRASVVRRHLETLPLGSRVMVLGDIERRNRKGVPAGVAAIAWAECAALGIQVEHAPDAEVALQRAGLVIAFHPHLEMSLSTAGTVDRARTAGVRCEVVTGRVPRAPGKS